MPPITAPMAPTPSPTISNLSGGGWYDVSSGGSTGSATSGTTSGTFAEYTQWMTFEYTRNPSYTKDSALPYYALNALSATKDVYSTKLHVVVTVYNSCKFIKGNFTLSSYTQPQKFSIDANKFDKMGISYGDVAGSSNLFVFGPQGAIFTSQPYIKRELKTDEDVEYQQVSQGATHYDLNWSGVGGSTGDTTYYNYGNSFEIMAEYKEYLPGSLDIGGNQLPYRGQIVGGDLYQLYGGGYNTSAEPGYGNNANGATRLIQFLESSCARLGAPYSSQRYGKQYFTPNIHWDDDIQKIPENAYYNTAHHQYS